MKKQKKKTKRQEEHEPLKEKKSGLKTETLHTIWAIVFFVLTFLFVLSAFGLSGPAGKLVYDFFNFLFGIGYVLLPTLFLLLGYSYLKSREPNIGINKTVSSILFILSGLGIVDVLSQEHAGGILGRVFGIPLMKLFDVYLSVILLIGVLIISLLIMFDTKPDIKKFFFDLKNIFNKNKNTTEENENEEDDNDDEEEDEYSETKDEEEDKDKELTKKEKIKEQKNKEKEVKVITGNEEESLMIKKLKTNTNSTYTPPPIELLEEDKGKPNTGDVKANTNIIKRTLQNFGIEVEMDEVTIGPTITRYALKPAEGVKLSRIVGLQNDLALALAAHPIRIEAPIPGRSLVGIEIPNKAKSTVGLGTLLKDDKFKYSPKPITIALGRGIAGKAVFGNLAKMPHALIAGTTGSGKSVTIHSIITSLLFRNGPEELKLILIDPKRVELTLYNKIPHLLTPVITEPKKAILSLKWAAKEMDRRYDIFETESVRDIESYHNNVVAKNKNKLEENAIEKLPYIVIIIDELADIMTAYPRELESAIVRLAQMSRAVGIHLILSTQRPEVNVITGLIKANVPARIALKVSSQIDSRTILDAGGAEKLLGAGDMLYSSGEAQPERLQSAFITESEVKRVVKYLSDAYQDQITEEINLTNGSISPDKSIFESVLEDEKNEDEDEFYEEARIFVIETGKASTSLLQRRFKLGYARAARIVDMLEERGVVGPGDGAKPREILQKIERDSEGNNII